MAELIIRAAQKRDLMEIQENKTKFRITPLQSMGSRENELVYVAVKNKKVIGYMRIIFKKNKVDYIKGHGHISSPGMVEIVSGKDKGKFFTAKNILVATGCKARALPDLELDGTRVMTSREALAMKKMPKSIVILGAGAIGVEFAYFLNTFGCEVTVVEMMDNVVPVEDKDISIALARSFKKQGIKIHTGTKAENVQVLKDGIKIDLVKGKDRTEHKAEALLIAIGVVPNVEKLLSSRVKLDTDRGYLKIDALGPLLGPRHVSDVGTSVGTNRLT